MTPGQTVILRQPMTVDRPTIVTSEQMYAMTNPLLEFGESELVAVRGEPVELNGLRAPDGKLYLYESITEALAVIRKWGGSKAVKLLAFEIEDDQ